MARIIARDDFSDANGVFINSRPEAYGRSWLPVEFTSGGVLQCDGTGRAKGNIDNPNNGRGPMAIALGGPMDYAVEVGTQWQGSAVSTERVCTVFARCEPNFTQRFLRFRAQGNGTWLLQYMNDLAGDGGEALTTLASGTFNGGVAVADGAQFRFRLEVQGTRYAAFIDDAKVAAVVGPALNWSGAGLQADASSGLNRCYATYFLVRRLDNAIAMVV